MIEESKKEKSSKPIVVRLCPDVDGGTNFEDYATKIGFEPVRVGSLQRMLVFLTTVDQAPYMVMMDLDFLNGLGQESREFISMIKTISHSRFNDTDTKVAVLIPEPVKKEDVRRWKDLGISGVVPRVSRFNYSIAFQAFDELVNRSGEFWDNECIEKKSRQEKLAGDGEISLTDRQREVQRLLCERGLSNKSIARQLNISESTVKIHVSAILKRYGVRNRTQLALAVKNGERL